MKDHDNFADSETKSRKKYKQFIKQLTRGEAKSASYKRRDSDSNSDQNLTDRSLIEKKFLNEEDEDLRNYVKDFKRKVRRLNLTY